MPIISFVHRVEQMHYLIKNKATGTPEQFAAKVGLSRRSLFLWIEQLRDDFNFPIAYDPGRKSYFYTSEGEFVFGFTPKAQRLRADKAAGNKAVAETTLSP
jgi:predicted DNA-binding transcriptional regulator YafY